MIKVVLLVLSKIGLILISNSMIKVQTDEKWELNKDEKNLCFEISVAVGWLKILCQLLH